MTRAVMQVQAGWLQHKIYVSGGWKRELKSLLPKILEQHKHFQYEQTIDRLKRELEIEREKLLEIEHSRRDFERRAAALEHQLTEAIETKASLVERRLTMEVELVRLKDKITTEYEAKITELTEEKLASLHEIECLNEVIKRLNEEIDAVRKQLESSEIEKAKVERLEALSNSKLREFEIQSLEVQKQKKQLESKIATLEEFIKNITAKYEDDVEDLERKVREVESNVINLKKLLNESNEHRISAEEEKKRIFRDYQQLSFDYEASQRKRSSLEETIKRYESGADNLASQLLQEVEHKGQITWKRDREKLELQLEEALKELKEKEMRQKELEGNEIKFSEHSRAFREKIESLDASIEVLQSDLKNQTRKCSNLEEKLGDQTSKSHILMKSLEEEKNAGKSLIEKINKLGDDNVVLESTLVGNQNLLKLAHIQIEEAKQRLNQALNERNQLEIRLRELQLQMLNSETPSAVKKLSASLSNLTAISELEDKIKEETKEREITVRENRRLERSLKDLSLRVREDEEIRIGLEERIVQLELSLRQQ